MKLSLPQNDPDPDARARALADARETYTYNYDYIPGAPLAERVPPDDWPSPGWMEKVAVQLVTILANTAEVDMELKRGQQQRVKESLGDFLRHPVEDMVGMIHAGDDLLKPGGEMAQVAEIVENLATQGIGYAFNRLVSKVLVGGSKGRAKSLEAFSGLFKAIPRQAIEDTYARDETFAQMRVQGPNPVLLRRIEAIDDRFPVGDATFREAMGPDDSLAAAGAEGRLYLCDYAAVDDAQCSAFPDGQKYVNAPLALFAVPRGGSGVRQLRPVAIQCRQRPGPDNPIFTPRDGHGWMLAKSIVQTADGNVHQAIMHLARSHLVLECFVMATRRQLAPNHPVRALLEPHFEGTISINEQAQSQLMANGGIVDQLLAGKIEVSRALTSKGRADWSFNTAMPRDAFRERGVDDASVLPYYPYRDDALLLWDAIHEWVGAFLAIYYPERDADVAADRELQAWLAELVARDGGRMKDIGQDGRIRTLDYLVDAAALVLFTASCQHGAVNFPQYELMSYAVNFPLAGYRDAPTIKEGLGEQDYLDVLPPLDMAHLQLDIGYLLGGIHHTTLGQYPHHLFGGPFGDSRVQAALATFQARLVEVEAEIARRNRDRPTPYVYLQPSSIPQSINI